MPPPSPTAPHVTAHSRKPPRAPTSMWRALTLVLVLLATGCVADYSRAQKVRGNTPNNKNAKMIPEQQARWDRENPSHEDTAFIKALLDEIYNCGDVDAVEEMVKADKIVLTYNNEMGDPALSMVARAGCIDIGELPVGAVNLGACCCCPARCCCCQSRCWWTRGWSWTRSGTTTLRR